MRAKTRIGLIRVLTADTEANLNAHGTLLEMVYPAFVVQSMCIDDQPRGIYDRITEQQAIPKIVSTGRKLAKAGCEAIIVSCTHDAGVAQLRAELLLPVIGAGSAAACVARSLATSIGVIGIAVSPPQVMRDILGRALIGARRPAGITTTLDLAQTSTLQASIELGKQLQTIGARVLALGCTGFSTIKAAEAMQQALGIPVVDPILAAGCIVRGILRRTGHA